jgi:penicillin-binding protein 2
MHYATIPPMAKHGTFQDPHYLKRLFRGRLIVVVLFILLAFFLLLCRLFYLQVIENNYFSTQSRNNSISLVPLPPPRGFIYDRNGVLLAENIPVFSLTLTPDRISNMPDTLARLQKIITISPNDLDQFNRALKQRRPFDSIPLKIKLTPEEVATFSVDQYHFPGVQIEAGLMRYYPFDNDLSSVLGYVGRINERDLTNIDQTNYAGTNYIGKVGVEKYFEDTLHGTVGYQQIETDATGRAIRVLSQTAPVPGTNIYLTIDSKLQEAALTAMKGDRGALVAIDPANGEILALVSTPSYDPNLFVRGISTKNYAELQNSPDQPLFNRAIRGQFPFGSTIKVFLALAGLDSGAVTPDEQIYDPGYFEYGDRTFRDMHVHGWVNLVKSIEVSCDTYYYRLSLKMGIDNIDKILQAFGFGQYTGIQMKEELPGLIATPEWKLKTRGQKWYPGDTINSSIGQGSMLTTPLQLASATATLAMHGVGYKPTLLLKTVGTDGVATLAPSIPLEQINLKPSSWNYVIEGMIKVVRGDEGTAWRFGKPKYSVGAKTGTAQVFSLQGEKYVAANIPTQLRDNSMFIVFGPVENPKIAIAVAIQNKPNAADIARKVMDYYLLTENHLNDATELSITTVKPINPEVTTHGTP